MKHLFTMLLALVAATASAYDFEADGIYYNILSQDDRTVEVTESPYGYAGDVVIPAEVMYDGSTYSVTTIGDWAFYENTHLTSIHIPASCTTIYIGAFAYSSLEKITVDEENTNYSSLGGVLYDKDKEVLICCPGGKSEVEIPSSVTKICFQAFSGCRYLTNIDLPSSVTIIDEWTFDYCYSLVSVSMPSVTSIGESAFYCCESLKIISMPTVADIGPFAFENCNSLVDISMPSATSIGHRAFAQCRCLDSVDLPTHITSIGEDAFLGSPSISSVYCHLEKPLECSPGFDIEVRENAILYVPTGTVDAYRSTFPWSEFINIEEKDYSGIADTPQSEVTVKVIDGVITVEGGDGTASAPVVEVYSAGGQCLYRGTDSSIGGLTHGVYVVKVDGTVQKVAL